MPAERIGHDALATDHANREAVTLMQHLRESATALPQVVVSAAMARAETATSSADVRLTGGRLP